MKVQLHSKGKGGRNVFNGASFFLCYRCLMRIISPNGKGKRNRLNEFLNIEVIFVVIST